MRPRLSQRSRGARLRWAAAVFAVTVSVGVSAASPRAHAADLTAYQITGRLHAAAAGSTPNLRGLNLAGLDLTNLDFKRADLSTSDLFGADFSGANLTGVNLKGAKLDRVILVAARFDGATLDGATLLRPSAYSSLKPTAVEAPSFVGSSLRRVRLFGRFSYANFERADFTEATCAPFGKTGFIEHIWRTEFANARMADATLLGADFTHALLTFADLRRANMRDVVLRDADLTGADLTDADVTGADVSGADLSGVIVSGATGLDTLKGLSTARNADRMIR